MLKKICLIILTLLMSSQMVAAQGKINLSFEPLKSVYPQNKTSLPLYLEGDGEEINAAQVQLNFSGTTIEDLGYVLNDELQLQVVVDDIAENSFLIMVSSQNIGDKIIISEKTKLLDLMFTPQEEGELKIVFDQENTLIASAKDASNLLGSLENKTLSVKTEILANEVKTENAQEKIEETRVPSDANLKQEPVVKKANYLIYILIVVWVVIIAAIVYILKNKKVKAKQTAATTAVSAKQEAKLAEKQPLTTSEPLS